MSELKEFVVAATWREKGELVLKGVNSKPMGEGIYFMDIGYLNDEINREKHLRAIPIRYMTLDKIEDCVNNPSCIGFDINNFKPYEKPFIEDCTPNHKP